MKHILITGTHLTPALALIESLAKKYRLTYIGKPSSLISIPLVPFTSPKLNRHNPTSAISIPIKLPLVITQAIINLKKLKPDLLISFGGFVALPICLAAKSLNIPIIIHEQTFGAGLVNKLTARFAKKIAISWPDSTPFFPKQKTILTGNPLRTEILKAANLKPVSSKRQTIYITGGNQGSKIINQTINQLLPQLLKQFNVIHQFGLNQSKSLWQAQLGIKKALPGNLNQRYTLKKWFNSNQQAKNFNLSNLVISRSGANTITELGFLKKNSVLIPLPYTQKNEQSLNADYLKNLGLAIVLPQSKLDSKTLFLSIKKAFEKLPQKSDQTFPKDLVKSASANILNLVDEVLSDS